MTNKKLGHFNLVYWVIGHLAYIAVLPAECHSPFNCSAVIQLLIRNTHF